MTFWTLTQYEPINITGYLCHWKKKLPIGSANIEFLKAEIWLIALAMTTEARIRMFMIWDVNKQREIL